MTGKEEWEWVFPAPERAQDWVKHLRSMQKRTCTWPRDILQTQPRSYHPQIQTVSLDAPLCNGNREKAKGGKKKKWMQEKALPWTVSALVLQRVLEEIDFFLIQQTWKCVTCEQSKVLPGGCLFITESCKLLGSLHQSSVSVILACYPRPSCVLTLFPEINSPLPSILPAKQTQVAECIRSLCSYICSSKDWPTKGKARVEIPSLDILWSAQK